MRAARSQPVEQNRTALPRSEEMHLAAVSEVFVVQKVEDPQNACFFLVFLDACRVW